MTLGAEAHPARARRSIAAAARALCCAAVALGAGCKAETPEGAARARLVRLEALLEEIGPTQSADRALEPLLVNFWATWCPPCVAELPDLQVVARERAGDVRVVTVSLDLAQPYNPDVRGPDDVAAFAAGRGLDFEILVLEGTAEELAQALDLPGAIPFTYARDAGGAIVARHEGQATAEEFRALFDAAAR